MGYLMEETGLDGRALGALMMEMVTAAENYGRLAKCFSAWQAEALKRMARECKAQASCVGGICALIMGEAPEKHLPCPDTGTLAVRLKKAYARAMRLLSACEGYSTDPEYGAVFRRLAHTQQEHCRKILEIIGSLS